MNELFDICVLILEWIGEHTGLGYKAANIWIFVIIHPLLTLSLLWGLLVQRRKKGPTVKL